MNEFSSLKAAWHIERIADLRAGKDIVPTHVQIILSDLCNQNCHFCLTEDAIIDTLTGRKPIKEIKIGEFVFGHDGYAASVTQISRRNVERVYEISCNGRTIRASAEHPILTQTGWKNACDITTSDAAVVRVRVRSEGEVESWFVEHAHLRPRDAREESKREGQARQFSVDESKQPYEAQGSGCEDVGFHESTPAHQVSQRHSEHCGGGEKADVICCESDEKSSHAQSCNGEDSFSQYEQERGALHQVGAGTSVATKADRRRDVLDRTQEPGYARAGAEKSCGGNAERMLHREAKVSVGRRVWPGYDQALPEQGMGMPGGVQAGSSLHNPGKFTANHTELCITGLQLERGLELRPIDSVREISGDFVVCNFSCKPQESYEANGFVVHNCAYRMDGGFSTERFADDEGNKNPKRMIPMEKVKEIIADCAAMGVGSIEFTGGGEPTVHPDCFALIEYAQFFGISTGLVTNGVRLKKHHAVENLTWLRISLDAGTPETYEKMRESKAWPKVMDSLKMSGGLKKPYVGTGFVVTRENYKELVAACQITKDAGIPYMRISAMFSTGGDLYYVGIEDQINAELEKAKKLQDANFKVVDFFANRVDDLKSKAPDYSFCGEQQFVLYIGGDQKVYTCCTNAYTTHGEIGDLKEQRFSEWIKSHRRFDFDARSCHHCQFNDKNRVINFMLDKAPKHINFV